MANTAYASQTPTHVTVELIDQAIAVCRKYTADCDQNFAALKSEVTALKSNGFFVGEAADGFESFFQQVTPMLTTDLTDPGNAASLISNLAAILEGVREVIITKQDPALGTANANALAGSAAAGAQA